MDIVEDEPLPGRMKNIDIVSGNKNIVGISGFRPRWDPIYRVCIMEFDTARLGLFVFYLYSTYLYALAKGVACS